MKLPKEGTNELPKDGKISNLTVLLLFANFLKNCLIMFLYFVFVYSFFGMILINCHEMDFIELIERSFSR